MTPDTAPTRSNKHQVSGQPARDALVYPLQSPGVVPAAKEPNRSVYHPPPRGYLKPSMRALALTLALSCLVANAQSTGSGIANLMRGMFTGLALLGQAGNTPELGTAYPGLGMSPWGGAPWAGNPAGMSPWGTSPPGMSPWSVGPWGGVPLTAYQGMPIPPGGVPWANQGLRAYPQWNGNQAFATPNSGLLRILQGEWETHSGGLLLVKGTLARLYVSRDRYQDLQIAADSAYVWMRPAGTSQAPDRYEYRVSNRHIVLRDQDQRILLLRRHAAGRY